MFVTTTQNSGLGALQKANQLATDLACQYVERGTSSLAYLKRTFGNTDIFVVGESDLKFVNTNGSVLFFHPSLAKIRLTSMLNGSKDRVLETAQVKQGDSILDCTTGLATDAIMFSFGVGRAGKVTTTESEPVPYILAREGLTHYNSGIKALDDAMRAINVVHANHLDYLKSQPSRSVDIVYFDPMFRQAARTVALTPIRPLANPSPLSLEAVCEAKRVARKAVVFREHLNSGEFERLGFGIDRKKLDAKSHYGIIRLG
jgi:hypothetical protein